MEEIGSAKIKVFGVGGGGCNAVNQMVRAGITTAEFVAINTDRQALLASEAPVKLPIGINTTQGLGAGADPERGEKAALESREEIDELLKNVNMLFITAGMGGGTGTGAAPVIASLAKNKNILTVAVVTTPFKFEGKKRMLNALGGIEKLRKQVDTLLIIPNEKLNDILPADVPIMRAFQEADEVLRQAVQSISDLIMRDSIVNLDFADVNAVMRAKGVAHMGIGEASGADKSIKAMRLAVASPLLESDIQGAKNIIMYFQGGSDLTLNETTTACNLVQSIADPDANIIWGMGIYSGEEYQNKVKITVIATGFPEKPAQAEEEEQSNSRAGASAAERNRPNYDAPVFGRPAGQNAAPYQGNGGYSDNAQSYRNGGGYSAGYGSQSPYQQASPHPARPGWYEPRYNDNYGGAGAGYGGNAGGEYGRNYTNPPSGFAPGQSAPGQEQPQEKRNVPKFLERLRRGRIDDNK